MNEYKIYVIFHKYLLDKCYKNDSKFNIEKYKFIKCNELFPAEYNKMCGYDICYEKDFNFYNSSLQNLSNPYMAVSAIYHIYKNNVYKDYKYIGFLEYDISLEIDDVLLKNNTSHVEIQKLKNITSITEEIEKNISTNKELIIILSGRHRFKSFFDENIIVNNKNIFYKILNEFNIYFNTEYTVEYLLINNPILGDQQSFLADICTFEKIMGFISHIIENKYAEISGLRPSFLLARYFGITLYLLDVPTKLISLKHLNKHEW